MIDLGDPNWREKERAKLRAWIESCLAVNERKMP